MNVSDLYFAGVNVNEALGASKVAVHDFTSMPQAEQNISRIAGRHRSTVTSKYYTRKLATARIYAEGSLDELRAKVGLLKMQLQHKQGAVKVNMGIPTLEATGYKFNTTDEVEFAQATLESMEIIFAKSAYVVEVVFILLDPIGKGSTVQQLVNVTANTAASYDVNFTPIHLQGTFEAQYPIIKITVNSVTNGNNPTISLTNGFNTATIKTTLAATDEIIIDTELLEVRKNGTLVDYSGVIPDLLLEDPELTISNTLTARNFDILVTNKARYI